MDAGNMAAVITVIVLVAAAVCGAVWLRMRKRYISFTKEISGAIDEMICWNEQCIRKTTMCGGEEAEEKAPGGSNWKIEDTLVSKVQDKLIRLSEITAAAARESRAQKQEIQGIVSDISHQLKTPVANIRMYCDILSKQQISGNVQEECLYVLEQQTDKLDFLVQSLMKMSRLENGMIHIHPELCNLRDTLEEIIRNVRQKATKKCIKISIDCEEEYLLQYDEKWTTEAMFNILDNAVKYTETGGRIRIAAVRLDIYTKIIIEDNGRGIAKEHLGEVCKRFYREEASVNEEGVGLGLYLARKILMMQNGYLQIESEIGVGTSVAVYLLNQAIIY